MPQNKIQGKFYPLQAEELINLRASKLINNAAYVHLALKYENPFCDRPIEIFPKQFALKWKIPESSVYKALARLKDLKLLAIKSGKVIISWIINSENVEPEPVSEEIAVNDYQIQQSIIRSENSLSDSANDYQIRENQELEPLQNIAFSSPQTLQNFQTNQTGGVEENNFQEEEVSQERKLIKLNKEVTQNESKKYTTKVKEKEDTPRDVVQKKFKIPDDLRSKLRELEIPLDEEVLGAINSHHISQAYGACRHIENTWETISNPRSIFLFQIPKQKVEPLGARLPEIGSQMRAENQAIEKEMASDEYQAKSQEMFAKLRAKLGRGGKKI